MIIFGIADRDDILRIDMHIFKHDAKPGRFIYPGGQNHDGTFVEDHLQLEPEFFDQLDHQSLVGFARSDNGATDRKRWARASPSFWASAVEAGGQRSLLKLSEGR